MSRHPATGGTPAPAGSSTTSAASNSGRALQPRPHQEQAFGHLERTLAAHPRAQLVLVAVAAAPGSRIDATRTWQLLDDLTSRGWPQAWLAGEFGSHSRALHPSRSTVTVDTARRVAELARWLATLPCPPRRGRQPLPRLDQLLADTEGAA